MPICNEHDQYVIASATQRGMGDMIMREEVIELVCELNDAGFPWFDPVHRVVRSFRELVVGLYGEDNADAFTHQPDDCPMCIIEREEKLDIKRWIDKRLDAARMEAVDLGWFAAYKFFHQELEKEIERRKL